MAGIVGVSAVGMLLDATGSWDAALFLPSMALMVTGSVCFTLLGRNEPIDFDAQDNSPLGVERWLEGPRVAAATAASAAVHAIEQALPHPPQAVVDAAKRARRAARRAAVRVASAADAMVHPEHGKAASTAGTPVGSFLSAASGGTSSSQPLPAYSMASMSSFSDMVSTSLSGMQGRGDGGQHGPLLVTHWTAASVMPDYDGFDASSSLDDEITDAEEEVARIMAEMKRKSQEGQV